MLAFFFSGPVVMDMSGYSEKGFKRKLAVQALFGKVFYLSEVSGQTVSHEFFPTPICCFSSVTILNHVMCPFSLYHAHLSNGVKNWLMKQFNQSYFVAINDQLLSSSNKLA